MDETARFSVPSDLAVDNAGNLYVMDRSDRQIRRIAATGKVTSVPYSWSESSRLAVDASGNLFVLTGTEIWKVTPDGSRVIYASYPQSPGSYMPRQISLDDQGRIYVLQQYRNVFAVDRVNLDRLTEYGRYSYSTFGSTFDAVSDAQGNLAVGVIGPTGTGMVTWVPQSAQPVNANSANLVAHEIKLNSLGKMAFDGAGNLYIADMTTSPTNDNRTVATGMRVIKVAPDGATTTLLSDFPSGQNGLLRILPSGYSANLGLAVSKNGKVFVAIPTDQAVYKIESPGKATLIAGKPAQPGITVSN